MLATDLPLVAQALTLALRGRAVVHPRVDHGMHYMWITGERANLVIEESDWLKIRPFIEDGTFDPDTVPKFGAGVDIEQDPLYQRVLSSLAVVFTKDFKHG